MVEMWYRVGINLLLFFICINNFCIVSSQTVTRICANNKHLEQCTQLQRGNSEVECQWVQDSIECAQRILNGTADFGVFSAESTLQLASLSWEGMTIIRELRHIEREFQPADYESVAIVRSSFGGGLNNLRGLKYCHPGLHYDRTQRWSERFLKHFERTVVYSDCSRNTSSAADLETSAVNDFFGSACRPGAWSNNPEEDVILKQRYPQLCSLCDGTGCNYSPSSGGPHQQALQCLKNGGDVAYVAAEEAAKFMATEDNTTFSYLCTNGSVRSMPCPWLRQPWKTIIARNTRNLDLGPTIDRWLNSGGTWAAAITEIIKADNYKPVSTTIQTPRDYFRGFREIPIPTEYCNTLASWCTISQLEHEKCEVIRHAGITTGVFPQFECKQQVNNDIACLKDIAQKRSDFTGIDSNFGYIARSIYNLSNALYAETENYKYSSVVVIVKDKSTYSRFENLKNSKGCFPELGGIASIAFVNIGKARGFLSAENCNYGQLLSQFVSEGCAPKSRELLNLSNNKHPENLCTLCRTNIQQVNVILGETPAETLSALETGGDVEINIQTENTGRSIDVMATQLKASCEADASNRFYGNNGALRCLAEAGDFAVVEVQNLHRLATELNINQHDFRIICRNGTLADRTGFDVDPACYLTTIVDGEVVVRRDDSKTLGIINALLSLDHYSNLDPDFKIFNIFSSTRNLLFKDSTLGLTTGNEENLAPSVSNYIQLFKNTEACVKDTGSNAGSTFSNYAVALMFAIYGLRYYLI